MLVDVAVAVELMKMAYGNLECDESVCAEADAHVAALEHLSRTSSELQLKGKVWLIAAKDRNVSRYREEGRFSNAPDTKQQKDLAQSKAMDVPVLMLLRQNGEEARGWRGLPFWWPVIVTPRSAPTAIFATTKPVSPATTSSNGNERPLSPEGQEAD